MRNYCELKHQMIYFWFRKNVNSPSNGKVLISLKILINMNHMSKLDKIKILRIQLNSSKSL